MPDSGSMGACERASCPDPDLQMRVSRKRHRPCGEYFSGLNRHGAESGVAALRARINDILRTEKIPVHLTLMGPVLNIACARIHGAGHYRPVFRVSSRSRHDLSARDAYAASARFPAQVFDPSQRSAAFKPAARESVRQTGTTAWPCRPRTGGCPAMQPATLEGKAGPVRQTSADPRPRTGARMEISPGR